MSFKRTTKWFTTGLAWTLCLSSQSFALKEWYAPTRSLRARGMGGAFYSLSNDEYALFYNPAGLSMYNRASELMLRINAQLTPRSITAYNSFKDSSGKSVAELVDELTVYQGKSLFAGAGVMPYFVRKNFAVGLLLADTKANFAISGRELDSDVDLTAVSDSGLVIGYGRPVGESGLHMGFNVKGLFRAGGRKTYTLLEIAQNRAIEIDPKELGGAGIGVDMDLGATYELPDPSFGIEHRVSLVLSNLLATKFNVSRIQGTPPGLNRMVSLGYYAVLPGWEFIENFHLLIDLAEFGIGGETNADLGARSGSIFKHLNFGVEMPVRVFAFRFGFNQGYLTAGVGVNLTYFRMDFATYGEELYGAPGRFESRRLALSIAIGSGSPPEPTVTYDSVELRRKLQRSDPRPELKNLEDASEEFVPPPPKENVRKRRSQPGE